MTRAMVRWVCVFGVVGTALLVAAEMTAKKPTMFGPTSAVQVVDKVDFSTRGTIACGSSQTGTTTGSSEYCLSSRAAYYRVELWQSATVTFSTCGSEYDTKLGILDSSGSVLTSCDDCGTCTPTQSTRETITRFLDAGTYYVCVAGFGSYTGNYVLSMTTDTECADFSGDTLGTMRCGHTVGSSLVNSLQTFHSLNIDYWELDLDVESGLVGTLSTCGSSLDTTLFIFNEDRSLINECNDCGALCDGGGGGDNLVFSLLPGRYYVGVSAASEAETLGTYTLSVTCGETNVVDTSPSDFYSGTIDTCNGWYSTGTDGNPARSTLTPAPQYYYQLPIGSTHVTRTFHLCSTSFDATLGVVDSSGNLVYFCNDCHGQGACEDRSETFALTLQPNSDYYVFVSGVTANDYGYFTLVVGCEDEDAAWGTSAALGFGVSALVVLGQL